MRPQRLPFDAGSDDGDSSDADDITLASGVRSRSYRNQTNSPRASTSGSVSRSRVATPPTTPTPRRRSGPASRTGRRSNEAGPSRPQPVAAARNSTRRKQRTPKKTTKQPKVLREIWKLQNTTRLLIPRLPFARLVKEILHQYLPNARAQSLALEALQEAAETYVTLFLEDSYRCTLHRGQVTLQAKDLTLVRTLRKTIL